MRVLLLLLTLIDCPVVIDVIVQRRQVLSDVSLDEDYKFCCPETNPVLADLLSVADRLFEAKPELKTEISQAINDNMSSEEFLGEENMRMIEDMRARRATDNNNSNNNNTANTTPTVAAV